ncbi:protein of unknown function [Hyphomicrobium sp. 1Nfss2.1]|uniref:hypothetical protein n=1 Tax=Hyphomicrobium sp. 1Nfss2.1 TaxID=3413936 RepID=UPI003C7CF304
MSHDLLENRVGEVEREQARQGARLERIELDMSKANAGIDKLLERDQKRPQAITWPAIAGVACGLAAVATVGWWLIGSAPAVQDLDRRLSKLDDPDIGRVRVLERRIDKLDGWQPNVVRN